MQRTAGPITLRATLVALLLIPATPALASWPPDGALVTGNGGPSATAIRLLDDGAQGHFVGRTYSRQATQVIGVMRLLPDGSIPGGWPANGAASSGSFPFPNTRNWDLLGDGGTGLVLVHRFSSSTISIVHALASGANDPAWPFGGATQSGTNINQVSAASDDSGGCYVAWYPLGNSIRVQRIASNGQRAGGWPAAGVAIGGSGGFTTPWLRALPAGGGDLLLLWLGSDYLWAQRFRRNGQLATGWPIGGLPIAGDNPPETQTNAALEVIPSGPGHAIAAWIDRVGGTRLLLLRFDYDGTPDWSGALEVFSTTTDSVRRVTLVPDGTDGAFALWDGVVTAHVSRVLSSGVIAPGWPAGGIDPITPGVPYQNAFAAAPTPAGGLIFAWPDGGFGRARWLLSDGSADPTQPVAGRQIHPTAHTGWVLALQTDGAGGAYAAWVQRDTVSGIPGPLYLSWLTYPTPLAAPPPSGRAALELGAPRPNPSSRSLELRLRLASDAPARLELFDLSGRRVRTREVAGAGEHLERFDGLAALRPGVYLVRLHQGTGVRVARVAIVH